MFFIANWKVKDFEVDLFSNNKPEYCRDYLIRLPLFSAKGPSSNTTDVQIDAEQDNWSLLNPVLDHENILLCLIKLGHDDLWGENVLLYACIVGATLR
jgi:hypothetical protein